MSIIKRILKMVLPEVVLQSYRAYKAPKQEFLLEKVVLPQIFKNIELQTITSPSLPLNGKDYQMLPIAEIFCIASLCGHLKPKKIFEFGTYKGFSTLVMAMNTDENAKIYTLDIEPAQRDIHEHGLGIGGFADFDVGEYFTNSSFSHKVEQLFCNTATFNIGDYKGKMDLIFVDADHSYEFVKSDTAKAFEMLAPGGVIVWDDYVWDIRHPECEGVARHLHELSKDKKIYWIENTRMAIYIGDLQ